MTHDIRFWLAVVFTGALFMLAYLGPGRVE